MTWLIALLLGANSAPAVQPSGMLGFVDAATLGEFCTSSGEGARDGQMVCLSYVTGAVDQLLAQQALGPTRDRTICVPTDLTAEAVVRTVTAYAGWSKSAKGISAAHFVKFAMEEAYPCDDDALIM